VLIFRILKVLSFIGDYKSDCISQGIVVTRVWDVVEFLMTTYSQLVKEF